MMLLMAEVAGSGKVHWQTKYHHNGHEKAQEAEEVDVGGGAVWGAEGVEEAVHAGHGTRPC